MRRVLIALSAVSLGGLLLSACGGSTATTTTAAPGTTSGAQHVVSIGVITPQDAGLTEFGRGMLHSVELAVAEANRANAVPGWTIKVVALDDSSDPAKGMTDAATMVADESVVAIVGPYNSGVSAAMLPQLAAANLTLVSPSNTLTSLTLGDDPVHPKRQFANYFRMVGADDKQGAFLADQAWQAGYRTVAVVSETKPVSKGLADIFAAAFEAKGGKVAVREVVIDGATDFTDFLTKATAAAPDFAFFGGEYPVGATLRKQATAAHLAVPLMGGDGIKDPAFIQQAGTTAEGSIASSVGVALESLASAAAYRTAYAAAGFADPPSAYGAYAYDAANAIIRALPAVLNGQTRPIDARAILVRALMTVTFDGSSGKVAFDQYGDTLFPVFTLYKVTNAVWAAAS